ncbi:MAG: 6-phosphofructokinase, partial [Candidatus Hodarchaeota archaeon]
IATGAAIILIPEKPFDLEKEIVAVLKERVKSGKRYHIIACSEGAVPTRESLKRDFQTISEETIAELPKDDYENPLLAKLNMSRIIVKELNLRADLKDYFQDHGAEFEIRNVVLGHTMRSGSPNSFDRLLGLRLGVYAAKLASKGHYGLMVVLNGENIDAVPLEEGAKKKLVPENSDLIEIRDMITKVKYLTK